MDGLRPLLPVDHGGDISESRLPARGSDRSAHEHARIQHAAHDLGPSYDEWGGFFDHVPPPFPEIPPADQAAGNQDGQLGFRLIASPFARHRVSHIVLEHTSVLRMIEWRWGLAPLTVRDATANNLAETLTLDRRRLGLPQFDVPDGPFGAPCGLTAAQTAAADEPRHDEMWRELRARGAALGFPV
jgi:phospholipase C